MTAKKAAAKKTVAKKAAPKQIVNAITTATENTDPEEISDMVKVARESVQGVWGDGRIRDDALRAAGHDPALVSKEAARQAQTRGVSWS